MHRQVVFASSRRLPLLALAGAALLLVGCQDGGGAPGPMESSGSSQTGETDRGTPGAPSGSEFSGEPDEEDAGTTSASEVSRDHGAGSGAEISGEGSESGADTGSDGGSDGGSSN